MGGSLMRCRRCSKEQRFVLLHAAGRDSHKGCILSGMFHRLNSRSRHRASCLLRSLQTSGRCRLQTGGRCSLQVGGRCGAQEHVGASCHKGSKGSCHPPLQQGQTATVQTTLCRQTAVLRLLLPATEPLLYVGPQAFGSSHFVVLQLSAQCVCPVCRALIVHFP